MRNLKDKTVVIYGSKHKVGGEHFLNVTADEYKSVKKGKESIIARTDELIQKGDVIKFKVMHFSFDQLHQKNWYLVPGAWEVNDVSANEGFITLNIKRVVEIK